MSDDSFNPVSVPDKPHGWFVALFVLAATVFAFFASEVISALLVGIYPAIRHWSQAQANAWLENSVLTQFAIGVIAYGLFIAAIWQVMRWLHWSWQDIGLRRPRLKHLAYGLLATVPYYMLYLGFLIIVSLAIPSLNLNQQQQIGFGTAHSTIDLVWVYVSLAVIPPIAEEIAMRGFLYTGLRKWLPKIVAALVVSALFAAAHLSEGSSGPLWIGAIDTFALSLVLVFLREKTGNLWAGIVLHAAKNSVAFALLFLAK